MENEKEWKPEPPESFAIEFLNTRIVQDRFPEMGFRFQSGNCSDDQSEVILKGARTNDDGTTIEIKIKKGENYKSLKQIEEEEQAAEKKRQENSEKERK